MTNKSDIKGNPFKISVGLLVISYVVGEFVLPYLLVFQLIDPLAYFFHLTGILGLIISVGLFIAGFNMFKACNEDPHPNTVTYKLIKTGIYAYSRNPIYLSFVLFFISMFFLFENVVYFLSAMFLAIWLHHWVIKAEEDYLLSKFNDEFYQYEQSVKRWLFF